MKKTLFIIAFLFTVFANAQGGPKVDVVKFRGEVTTTVRNTFDVPVGERWLIWNVTTSQFEHAGSDDVWNVLGVGDGDKGDIVVSSSGTDWQLDSNSVTGAEIVNGTISAQEIANAAIDLELLADTNSPTTGQVLGWSGSGSTFTWVDKGGGTASDVEFTPYSTITSTDVQAAIEELKDEVDAKNAWSDVVDSDILSDADNTRDIGSVSNLFSEIYGVKINAEIGVNNGLFSFIGESLSNLGKRWKLDKNATSDDFQFSIQPTNQTTPYIEIWDTLYTLNSSGIPANATDLIDKAYADANYGGSGDPDQTLSLGGTGNKDLTISGTGGNTVTLPTLANSNQTVASGNRDIQMGITAQLNFLNNAGTNVMNIQGGSTRPTFPNNISVSAPTQSDDAIRLQDVETMQQYYVIQNATSDIITNADFNLAKLYKSLFYRNIDTLEAGDGVTFATHGNKPVMVQPTTKDSTYIKKADGVDFYVAGQKAAITGDGLIVKNRNTAVGYKEGADAWYWSGDLTVHTEFVDAIMATTPEFFYSPSSIDADAVSDGDAITGANAWTDASGNGHDLTIGSGTFELNVQAGVGRQVRWTSPGYFDVPDDPSLDVVPGTDEFTMIFRVGETLNPDGSGYAIAKAPASNRTGVYFDAPGSFADVLVGGTGTAATPDTFSANSLVIVVVGTTTFDMWVDGTQVVTGGTVGTGDPTGQSWNIGGRTDGSYLAGIGYTTDLVAMTKKAISTAERQAIEAQYQINP
jgi:hypothetical protein